MARAGLLAGFVMLTAIGLSIYGLFNRQRSILCLIGGAMLAIFSCIGTLYSWIETSSVTWSAIYFAGVLLGVIAAVRQGRI